MLRTLRNQFVGAVQQGCWFEFHAVVDLQRDVEQHDEGMGVLHLLACNGKGFITIEACLIEVIQDRRATGKVRNMEPCNRVC